MWNVAPTPYWCYIFKSNDLEVFLKNRLKELRLNAGLTQKDLALHSGTSQAQIDRLEKGTRRMTPEWLERLAPTLGCDPLALLGQQTTLSDQENRMLRLFRPLSDEQKQALIATLKAFQPVQKQGPGVF